MVCDDLPGLAGFGCLTFEVPCPVPPPFPNLPLLEPPLSVPFGVGFRVAALLRRPNPRRAGMRLGLSGAVCMPRRAILATLGLLVPLAECLPMTLALAVPLTLPVVGDAGLPFAPGRVHSAGGSPPVVGIGHRR